MRKTGINILLLSAVLMTFSISCKDKDAERRIAELEQRLHQVEGSGQPGVVTPTAQQQPEQKPEGPLPVMEFETMEYDFGTITEGDIVKTTFKFTNNGEAPLIIQSARGSCGCTVPSWPREPIPVGGTGEITAEFNSKGKPGNQNKLITITSNTWPKNSTLRIKATVNKAG